MGVVDISEVNYTKKDTNYECGNDGVITSNVYNFLPSALQHVCEKLNNISTYISARRFRGTDVHNKGSFPLYLYSNSPLH